MHKSFISFKNYEEKVNPFSLHEFLSKTHDLYILFSGSGSDNNAPCLEASRVALRLGLGDYLISIVFYSVEK